MKIILDILFGIAIVLAVYALIRFEALEDALRRKGLGGFFNMLFAAIIHDIAGIFFK